MTLTTITDTLDRGYRRLEPHSLQEAAEMLGSRAEIPEQSKHLPFLVANTAIYQVHSTESFLEDRVYLRMGGRKEFSRLLGDSPRLKGQRIDQFKLSAEEETGVLAQELPVFDITHDDHGAKGGLALPGARISEFPSSVLCQLPVSTTKYASARSQYYQFGLSPEQLRLAKTILGDLDQTMPHLSAQGVKEVLLCFLNPSWITTQVHGDGMYAFPAILGQLSSQPFFMMLYEISSQELLLRGELKNS